MIYSTNIYLRSMELSDVKIKVKWLNDNQVRSTLGFFDYPVSELATEAWLKRVINDDKRKDFIICLKENNEPIGFCGVKNIDLKNLKAESFMGIGDTNSWGKGYGFETKKMLMDYAFTYLNLNKIYSFHEANNEASIRINNKLGAHKDGLLREEIRGANGLMKDLLIMSILKKDYPFANQDQ